MTALMVGGRVGAGIAAELGSMAVTEQIDAVRVLGADPDVGQVRDVDLADPRATRNARVVLAIKTKYSDGLRKDSVAAIDSKGLLGDKLINISVGSPDAPPVRAGDTLRTKPSASFERMAQKLDEAISSVTKVSETADQAIRQISTDDARQDIGRIVASTARVLERVEHGPGFAHRFFYDPSYGKQVEAVLASAHDTLEGLGDTTRRLSHALAAVEHGGGLAHELLYGNTGRSTIVALREAASQIAAITSQLRDGDGLLHELIFEPRHRKALEELDQAATGINAIVANVERGQGTIGGLLVDPTVYEDLTTMLGNINRNVLLKTLIRFTIKQGNIQRPASMAVEPVDHSPADHARSDSVASP